MHYYYCHEHGPYAPRSFDNCCPSCPTRWSYDLTHRNKSGWTCGKCGRSNNPVVLQCPCFTPEPEDIDSDGGGE